MWERRSYTLILKCSKGKIGIISLIIYQVCHCRAVCYAHFILPYYWIFLLYITTLSVNVIHFRIKHYPLCNSMELGIHTTGNFTKSFLSCNFSQICQEFYFNSLKLFDKGFFIFTFNASMFRQFYQVLSTYQSYFKEWTSNRFDNGQKFCGPLPFPIPLPSSPCLLIQTETKIAIN